jgi:hypothetical protein
MSTTTTTHSGSSISADVRGQVRDQVARARHAVSITAAASEPAAAADNQRDFVRHYLRFLSVQAVGKFTDALGRLASGLDVLGRRTSDTQAKLARTEQDVLHLTAALERVRDLPQIVAALDARVAHAESRLGAPRLAPAGTAEDFINAAARHLREIVADVDGGRGIALAPVPDEWLAAMYRTGVEARPIALDALDASPDLPAGSADVITALCTFDAMSLSCAQQALESCRHLLRAGGALFVVIETMPAGGRPALLDGLHPRVNDPGRLATLAKEAGFDRVIERPLDAGRWPACRVVIARCG